MSTDSRKLMDRLAPKSVWGEILGLVSTTFEMQPDFVETDFLPAILGLGAWDDRNWNGRVALERKLALMESAVLLQDARRYARRPRSLRVEHRLATGPNGQRLHGKVMLLVHERAVRLLVGSANLTEPGYRRNREVVTSLVATSGDASSSAIVRQAVASMPGILAAWWSPGAQNVIDRAVEQLDAWGAPTEWAGAEFAWSGGTLPLWRRVLDQWPRGRRVTRIRIVSPFWSDDDGPSAPVAALVEALRERDALAAGAEVHLLTELRRDSTGEPRPVLPPLLAAFDGGAIGVRAFAHAVDGRVLPEEIGMQAEFLGTRALHAKVVLLEGDEAALMYAGSANFTRRGWGFLTNPTGANIEAGLVLLRTDSGAAALSAAIPATAGTAVPLDGNGSGHVLSPEAPVEEPLWPAFLREVRLTPALDDPDRLDLIATIDPASIAGEWSLAVSEAEGQTLYWCAGRIDHAEVRIALDESTLRALLRSQEVDVSWWASASARAVPLNVDLDARTSLPVSPEGGTPSEALLLAYYQGQISWEDLFPPPPDWNCGEDSGWDPPLETGVDTSRIQSYQVREFVESLAGIAADLEGARVSEAGMRLALCGPVSPVTLARGIARAVRDGTRSPTAGTFELVELLVCLDRAREQTISEDLRSSWLANVGRAIAEIGRLRDSLVQEYASALGKGTNFARYERTVRRRASRTSS